MNTVDQTVPGEKWVFDQAVADAFNDMLQRSVPDYEHMRLLTTSLGRGFVRDATEVVDLGCSRGEALAPLVEEFGARCRYVGVEVSEPMLAAARERFAGYVKCGVADLRAFDLRTGYPPVRASLTLCVLTLQFTPIEHRQRILRDVYRSTLSGGALMLVEKVLGATADIDELLIRSYYDVKRANGYSEDQIARKRLSLEGVLVPVTARWNEELLRQAGFSDVDCYWRRLNFAGWVAVKR
jgi:tRNA (cmo5U34)-methyltransferase